MISGRSHLAGTGDHTLVRGYNTVGTGIKPFCLRRVSRLKITCDYVSANLFANSSNIEDLLIRVGSRIPTALHQPWVSIQGDRLSTPLATHRMARQEGSHSSSPPVFLRLSHWRDRVEFILPLPYVTVQFLFRPVPNGWLY